ncbi:hypothetical protein ACWDRB_65455 [Nonomuraea sp. NPDC003707]
MILDARTVAVLDNSRSPFSNRRIPGNPDANTFITVGFINPLHADAVSCAGVGSAKARPC